MEIKHDWLLENIANPDLDTFDLVSLGEIDSANTQFLSKNEYLQSDFVRNAFTDENGKLKEKEFDAFYNNIAEKWRDFQDDNYTQGLELSAFDTSVRPSSRIKDYNFYLGNDVDELGRPNNPDRVQKGIEGFRTISKKTKSEAELAQYSQIFDPETGEYLEETPNDLALTNNPLRWLSDIVLGEPLVLAAYEQDEADNYGIEHKKGELKLNQYGTYYYEKLGERSPIGKQILSVGDLITPENSTLNQLDFFDSDDLQKSVPGIVAKNIALLAPTFMGPQVAGVYYTALVAKELAKSLPMLASWINVFNDEYETPEWVNKAANMGHKLSSGTSVYSRENVFTFENIANLLSDVALQWGQQKKIAEAVNYFSGQKGQLLKAEKLAENFYKQKAKDPALARMAIPVEGADWKSSALGQASLRKFVEPLEKKLKKKAQFGADAALIYMALASNYDVYNNMLERGATKQEAALVSAGSTLGMFGVNKLLGLDNLFFEEITPGSAKAVRQVANEEIKQVTEKLFGGIKKPDAKGFFKKGIEIGKSIVKNTQNKFKNKELGVFGKALGEGFEEVGEEFVTDLSKQLYDFGAYNSLIGYDKTIKSAGTWEQASERYAMSLLGGFLGGGLYGLRNYKYNRTLDWDIVDAIRSNKADDLRNEIKKRINEGSIHNTHLSGTKHTINGNDVTWLSTTDKTDSQNDLAGKRILEKIDALEAVILGNGVNKTDEELFQNMVMQEARFATFQNASHITGYYDEYKHRLNKLLQAELAFTNALDSSKGTPNESVSDTDNEERKKNKQESKDTNIAQLRANRDQVKKEFEQFLSGDTSLEYTRKLSFALDPVLNSVFLDLDFKKWLKDNNITEEELEKDILNRRDIIKQWQEHVKNTMSKNIDDGFYSYLAIENAIKNALLEQQQFEQQYKAFNEQVNQLLEDEDLQFAKYLEKNPLYTYDSRLVGENGETETDDYVNSLNGLQQVDRIYKIQELNNQIWNNYISQFDSILQSVNYNVDAATARALQQSIGSRGQDVIRQLASLPYVQEGSLFRRQDNYVSVLKNLKHDLSNLEQISKELDTQFQITMTNDSKELQNLINLKVPGIKKYYTGKQKDLDTFMKELERKESHEELVKLYKEYNELDRQARTADKEGNEELANQLYDQRDAIEDLLNEGLKGLEPEEKLMGVTPITTFLKDTLGNIHTSENGTYLNDITIEQFIQELQDPNSQVFQLLTKQEEEIPFKLYEILNTEGMVSFGKDAKMMALLGDLFSEENLGQVGQLQRNTVQNYLNNIVGQYKQHPLYNFWNKLKVQTHTPIENIFKSINKVVSDGPKDVVNINHVLDQVYNNYMEANSIHDFRLNPAQEKQLANAENVLKLVGAYIYSASNPTKQGNYFAHNSQINEFAKKNQSKLSNTWEPLAEISNDFGVALMQEVERLLTEVSMWKKISANNQMNKINRLVNVEQKHLELKRGLINKLSKVLSVDEDKYDLKEGVSDIGTSLQDIEKAQQTIYKNFVNAVNKSELSVEDFFEKTKFWETLLGQGAKISSQHTNILNEGMEDLSDFDRAMRILEFISEDPSEYYENLGHFINDNPDIAPITAQLVGSRIGQIAHTPIFKAGFKALAKYAGIDNLSKALNTVHMNGTAGAGKTEVQLKAIRQRFHKEKALVIAPTQVQAVKLQKALSENTSYTFDETEDKNSNIFAAILPDWEDIRAKFDLTVSEMSKHVAKIGKKYEPKIIKNKYFTAHLERAGGNYNTVFELSDNIVFNSGYDQSLIFVDEAAHLNPLQIMLLDKLAENNKGTLYLANDDNQDGFEAGDFMENLTPKSIFATRTPKLQESLRSSNIQKQENDSKVNAILDTWNYLFNNNKIQEAKAYINGLSNVVKNLNLRAYTKDDINGYLYDANIDEVISKIPKIIYTGENKTPKEPTIGFIGNENSPIFAKLQASGLNVYKKALSPTRQAGKQFMQGQEFDYVIVDKLDLPDKSKYYDYNIIKFLRTFNTLATRSKIGTIFMDDLSPYLGKNQIDSLKSAGFSIEAEVKNVREVGLKSIKEVTLDKAQEVIKTGVDKKALVKVSDEFKLTEVPPVEKGVEYSIEATEDNIDKEISEVQKVIAQSLLTEETNAEEDSKENISVTDSNLNLMIMANLTAPIIGLPRTDVDEENNKLRYHRWMLPGIPKQGEVRRNAAALFYEDTTSGKNTVNSLKDKRNIQAELSRIQSAVTYGSEIKKGELKSFVNFGDVWENRKLYLEFRPATDQDYFGVGSHLKDSFIDVDGKRYIISTVLKLEGLRKTATSDSFDALFDISLMNSPHKLSDNEEQKKIKARLRNKLKNGKIPETRKQDVENFISNIKTIASEWSDFVETIVKNNKEGAIIELSPEDYTLHKTTVLHNTGYDVRLGGNFSLQDAENNNTITKIDSKTGEISEVFPEDWNNFEDVDNRKVVSPVYIFGEKSEVLDGIIDGSLLGKAVVFVSGNTNLEPEELADRWLAQVKNPNLHTPEVRAVPLNNHGVSFSEFVTHKIQKQLESGKFHRMDVTGLRMFHALWNTRADLQNFKNIFDAWKKKMGYSLEQIENITRAEAIIYDENNKDGKINWDEAFKKPEVQKVLSENNVTENDIRELTKFNLEDSKKLLIFRLGADYTKKRAGGYVRSFKVGKKNKNMYAIEYDMAVKYEKILSTLLNQMTSNETPEEFKTLNTEFNNIGVRIVHPDNSSVKSNEYIGDDAKKIAGMIRTSSEGLHIEQKDQAGNVKDEYKIHNSQLFSFIPKLLGMTANQIKKYQKDQSLKTELLTISTINKDEVKGKIDFLIYPFFEEGMIKKGVNDNSFFNIVNLAFHGTVDSIEYTRSTKEKKGKARSAYTSYAPMKYGFLVDPELRISDNYMQENIGGIDGKNWTLLRCGTNKIFFDVNVEVRPSGISLNLRRIMDKYYGSPKKAKVIVETPKVTEEPKIRIMGYSKNITDDVVLDAFMKEVLQNNYQDTEQDYNKFLKEFKNSTLKTYFSGTISNYSESDYDRIKDYINDHLKDRYNKARKNREKYNIEITHIDNSNPENPKFYMSSQGENVEVKLTFHKNRGVIEVDNIKVAEQLEKPIKEQKTINSMNVKPEGFDKSYQEFLDIFNDLIANANDFKDSENIKSIFNTVSDSNTFIQLLRNNFDSIQDILLEDLDLSTFVLSILNDC